MSVQPVSSADEARARAERIRDGIRAMASWADDVRTAWLHRDDRVLGYPSWSDYLHGEFDMLPRLSKPQRDAAMTLLAEAGMPQRQIGATTGVDHATVSRAIGANAPTTEGEAVTTNPDDPLGRFENSCYVDPSGGATELQRILRTNGRILDNYYRDPAAHHLDLIEAWLERHTRKAHRARKELGQ